MKKNTKTILFYIVLIAIFIVASNFLVVQNNNDKQHYSDIVTLFENEQVKSFEIKSDNTIIIKTRELHNADNSLNKESETITFRFRDLNLFYNDLNELITEQHKDGIIEYYDYEPIPKESPIMSWLPFIFSIIIVVVLWFFIMNNAMGGKNGKIGSFGKSHAKVNMDGKTKVMFSDVAGADEEKEELKEVVDFLRSPKKFTELGAKIPRGVLLVGPPGTGKTLLAKAVAGEANVPFFSISGSDFVEMYVGVGASRVRDLFETAKKTAPAIIFIDEIDAVGRHRGAGLGGGHDEREQTLNQLLVEMDGFSENAGIIVIAATNRPDILDPALLRPGRFDRQITVNYPDVKGREEILKVHARNKPLEKDVDLSVIAKTTAGFTGADLANLLNEAALLSARKSKRLIGLKELEEAMIKVVVGPHKKSKVISDKSKKLTAYHEAGHAVSSFFVKGHDEVHQISIIPAGRAGGYTLYLPKEDRDFLSKNDMEGNLISLLGGRVAEALTLDDISTGASNDIQRATDIARNMVTKYGMSEKLGPIVYGENQEEVFLGMSMTHSRNYSETIASEIDSEVKKIIDTAYKATEKILTDHMDKVVFIAEYLINHELMDEDQFKYVMNNDAPTVEALEEIANQKAEKSKNENNDAAEELKKKEEASNNELHEIDPNASRYSIKRKIIEETSPSEQPAGDDFMDNDAESGDALNNDGMENTTNSNESQNDEKQSDDDSDKVK